MTAETNFSVVKVIDHREIGRTVGMPLKQALKYLRRMKLPSNQKAYVEETMSVKHLPVNLK
jgi:hypothetical protein